MTPSNLSPVSSPDARSAAGLREAVLDHLWRRFPAHCVVLTDPRCRSAVDVGIARAARHGFRDAAQVRSFVIVMIFLGSYFDQDPQLPWAQERLRRSATAARHHAIDDLLAAISTHMEPQVGRDGEYYRRALAWIGARSFDALAGTYAGDDDGLRLFVRHSYRRKHDALGDAGVGQLLREAQRVARRHGLSTPSGALVMLGLMLLLGASIDRDPFHPWVGQQLAASSGHDPEHRARELYARAQEILARHTRLDALSRRPLTED